jgi:putative ABC transport system substrate-binding protein
VALLALAFLVIPVSTHSQQPARRPYRVGVLESGFSVLSPLMQGLKAGLKAEGLEEGREVVYDVQIIQGDPHSITEGVKRLLSGGAAVILTHGEEPTRAAMNASHDVPIVFIGVGDPVAARIVTSVAHPGGNVTGISGLTTELERAGRCRLAHGRRCPADRDRRQDVISWPVRLHAATTGSP